MLHSIRNFWTTSTMKTSATIRSKKKTGCKERKDDCEHILTKLLKAEVGDSIDLVIRPTYMNCHTHALIVEAKSFLQQMSTIQEDDMLAFV